MHSARKALPDEARQERGQKRFNWHGWLPHRPSSANRRRLCRVGRSLFCVGHGRKENPQKDWAATECPGLALPNDAPPHDKGKGKGKGRAPPPASNGKGKGKA